MIRLHGKNEGTLLNLAKITILKSEVFSGLDNEKKEIINYYVGFPELLGIDESDYKRILENVLIVWK